ncbi:MAG: hypothetical protein UHO61_06825 [Acutalibacteraceae bacterium]|nr:hypothetical protein [Acutalibacteraceae bacterium]
MFEKSKKKRLPVNDISSEPFGGMPETAFEMVNRYGTYEIQATADTENMYPAIAQGFNNGIIKTDRDNPTEKGENQQKK